jgi:hypothetical protein
MACIKFELCVIDDTLVMLEPWRIPENLRVGLFPLISEPVFPQLQMSNPHPFQNQRALTFLLVHWEPIKLKLSVLSENCEL